MEIQFGLIILSVCCASLAIPTEYNCADCDPEQCVEEKMECCSSCSAKIRCSSTQMTVAIPRSSTSVPLEELSFADISCGGTQNNTHFILKTSYKNCGTKMVPIRNSHYVYKNEIRRKSGQPLYSLTCLFDRKVKTARRDLHIRTGENKKSRLYHTSMHGRRLNNDKLYLEDEDYLFFEVKGPSTLRARNLIMGVKKCQLEITEDSNEPGLNPKIDVLINDGYV